MKYIVQYSQIFKGHYSLRNQTHNIYPLCMENCNSLMAHCNKHALPGLGPSQNTHLTEFLQKHEMVPNIYFHNSTSQGRIT